jgi:transcription antitermination factor NusG
MKLCDKDFYKNVASSRSRLGAIYFAAPFFVLAIFLGSLTSLSMAQTNAQAPADSAKTPPITGTVKALAGNSLVVTDDAGADMTVAVRDSTKIVRVAPGMTDLKQAQPIALKDLQPGDRVLVRTTSNGAAKSVASMIITMTKADLAAQHARERATWQSSGVGGLVNSVDPSTGVVSVTAPSLREKKTVAVKVTAKTVLRRYAPGSVKFDDAKPAPLSDIRPGDQLRARGEKNADGTEITAVEVVSGSFRNVSGTISSLDAAQGTVTVKDLATKKPVTIKITPESQLRKLPAPLAQRIAIRLQVAAVPQSAGQGPGGGASNTSAESAKEPASAGNSPAAGGEGRGGDAGGRGRGPGAGGGPPDLQQMISRLPAVTIADLQKDDAVMLVGTEANGAEVTAITLLAGVEPILQRAPSSASSILSPWSLSSAPSGE